MKKGLKITLIILGIIVVLIAGALLIVPKKMAMSVYNDYFGKRYATDEAWQFQVEEFDGLAREKHIFTSNEGQKLTGYIYSKGDTEAKGLIVIAHGFGAGHNSYMDVADYFASNGYKVFAYDATGNDESEGESVKGFPQGIIDLDYALNYIKNIEELSDLPVMLWGHSWGGYSVCSVSKLHPEIKGIISVAGFNKSLDMLESTGRELAGDAVDFVLPIFEKHETKNFGDYAAMSALESLENSNTKVLMFHSADDDVIPIEISYDRYYEKFADNERFSFVRFEDKGHNNILISKSALEYRKEYNKAGEEYVSQFGEGEFTDEMRREYIKTHFDKSKGNELDSEMMSQMIEFYNNCIA